MAEDNAALNQEPAVPTEPPKRGLSLLAAEMFGQDFHGEVEKPQPETADAPEETPEDAGKQAVPEHAEDAGDEAAEGDKDADEVPISSVQELIEHHQFDPEWFNTLKASVKVDGQTADVPLADLVKSYQIGAAADKRLEEAKTKAKAIQDEAAEKSGQIQAQFAVAAKLVTKLETALTEDISGIDWNTLRTEDPAEFAAKKTEFAERGERIEQMKREAYGEFQESVKAQQEQSRETHQQRLVAEQAALLESLPEWRDSEKAKAEKAEVADYLISRGFSQEDVMGASDHRLILVAREAMLYRKTQSNTDAARKKLAKVPKVLKPGAPKPEQQRNKERTDKVVAEHRARGTVDTALAALRAKRGGN